MLDILSSRVLFSFSWLSTLQTNSDMS